jgi:predicted nuclease of predicted toxin-antitoxin system
MKFIVDENLPRALAGVLAAQGHDAVDVRDQLGASADDELIAEHARTHGRCIITRDFHFADVPASARAARRHHRP